MAVGKGRHKRSSGSSCASSATTVGCVGLCVFVVYMLTPTNLISSNTPTTTTRTAVSESSTTTNSNHDTSSMFEDNPGDLPKDALKNDEGDEDAKDSTSEQGAEVMSNDDKKEDSLVENSDKQEQLSDQAENVATTANAEIEHIDTKDQLTEDVKQEADAAGEENQKGLQGKVLEEEKQQKLNEKESQLSEESSVTHNQETDQEMATNTDDKSKSLQERSETMNDQNEQTKDEQASTTKNDEVHHDESKGSKEDQNSSDRDDQQVKQDSDNKNTQEEDNTKETVSQVHENPEGTKNEVSEEENEQRMERQQQREEEQVKQNQQQEDAQHDGNTTDHEGASSKDQIEHDEANIDVNDSSDQNKSSQESAEEKNLQTQKQDALHDHPLPTNDNVKNNKHHKEKKRRKKKHNSSDTEDKPFQIGENSGIPKESKESKKAWATQADQSDDHKERKKGISEDQDGSIYGYSWPICNVTASADYIPCLDNEKAISKLHRRRFEHRERHCPEEPPTCLVPLPKGYKTPVEWPRSRDKIWYHNVPHIMLTEVKGHQNWVKLSGEFLTFPGGGTQFIHGALHYIDFLQEAVPDIAWGNHTRTVLDVGCGVASFGGYLFERDVLAMSFAPKDEHEAQVQFALERGIPAISAVMGTQRLQFPSRVFDLIHCARCRVPWHAEGGALLLELNRMLRPGGYFVWSATPVYQKLEEDVQIWKEMSALTKSMCWELVTIKKDNLNMVGAAFYRKPVSNECYKKRKQKQPPMCKHDDDPNAAWYVPLQSCMHSLPVGEADRGSQWPQEWPRRLQEAPYWLNQSQMGIYGKPAPDDFVADYEHWQRVVSKSYLSGLGISWSNVRNVMDMRAVYGGFAAALKDLKVWVLNVVNIDSPDTLPIIYERGLFGIYHDWCQSFSTYPRTYDLLHADHLFSRLKKRCRLEPVMAEVDRIVRPGGKVIVRDESSAIEEVKNLLKSLHWEVHLTFSKNKEGILSAQKSDWRPESYAAAS